MAKAHSVFVCQQCGYESPRWLGKCPSCGEWNSLVETLLPPSGSSGQANKGNGSVVAPQKLSEITSIKTTRIKTNIDEFDQILGGGIVTGQVILIAGAPGIGKSTLLLQISDSLSGMANNLGNTLYVSGEESTNQIAIRANRLKIKSKNINIIESTDIDSVISSAEAVKPNVLIIDSIQTMATSDLTGMAGSVGQVRECAFRLVRYAKSNNVPVFIVGHVTKEGSVAGPSVLAHIVDTVLWFEGNKSLTLRMIRAIKNRFGPTDEVGVFEMNDKGLISISNPEKIFLTDSTNRVPGSVVSSLMQGTRPILVEIESLIVSSRLAFPKRIAQGIDSKRFELLLAVLTKRCNIPLYEYDAFVNVAGGISARDPSCDLAICLSIASSFYNKPINKNILAIGEVGLLGEIRKVTAQEKIIKQAKKLGYIHIVSSSEFKSLSEVIHNFFMSTKKSK